MCEAREDKTSKKIVGPSMKHCAAARMHFTDPIAVGSILGRSARIPAKTDLSEERVERVGSSEVRTA